MSAKNDQPDALRDHAYDGIREYDNRLPRWWLYLFYITIAFAPPYLVYYHLMGGPTLRGELAGELKAIEGKRAVAQATTALSPDEGRTTFGTLCAPCHGTAGQGAIGPNLTDKYWLHGGTEAALVKVIGEGVLDKGMPAWQAALGPAKVAAVAAYVLTLKGTNPPDAKAPQGEPVE
jgi:cytochrome c oxidase cbb3-type subunit 3